MRRVSVFGEISIQLNSVRGYHVQLARQVIELPDYTLEFRCDLWVFFLEALVLF